MAESYTAKKISELQETTSLTDKDFFVINEYNYGTGYTLTKKVLSKVLYEYAYKYILPKLKLDEYFRLSSLAYCDFPSFLLSCVLHNRGEGLNITDTSISGQSLALSTYNDLELGDLSKLNLTDLKLENYALKGSSSQIAKNDEYITGIVENNGRIIQINTAKFSEALKIDSELNNTSQNAVQNAAINAALNTKVNKVDASCDYILDDGWYISGIKQREGKIVNVQKRSIPKNTIDAELNGQSSNPVQNKAIVSKFNEFKLSVDTELSNNYVKKINASSTLTAGLGKYITSITQKDGKLTSIGTASLPSTISVDAKLSDSSANPVQNKVITENLNNINENFVKKSDASSTLTAGLGKYITSITQKDGKLTSIGTASLPDDQTLKYSDGNILQGSGNVNGDSGKSGVTVFTAPYDCIISFTVSIPVNVSSCDWRSARYAWLKYAGSSTKVELVKMEKKNSGLTNCMFMLKQGDQLIVSGGCSSSHGTQWSYSGTSLTRE